MHCKIYFKEQILYKMTFIIKIETQKSETGDFHWAHYIFNSIHNIYWTTSFFSNQTEIF